MSKSLLEKSFSKFKEEGLMGFLLIVVRYLSNYKKRRYMRDVLRKDNMEEKFQLIYERELWGSKESKSGLGSELEYTLPLRSWLIENIPMLDVKKLIDAPCGDFNWMRFVLEEVNVEYLGLDIVDSIVKRNNLLFSKPNLSFARANICEDAIPGADLIIVRDCLFHLSDRDINDFLENLNKTDYKYLMTTTHIVNDCYQNENIITGDFRIIDLFSSPYSFPLNKVVARVNDYPPNYPIKREMILLEKKDVPKSIYLKN
jgi:hypothetical protein